MTTLVFIFIGMAIGAALVGAYLLGRERGRMKAMDEVARTMGPQILGRRSGRADDERSQAEMAVVGEAEGSMTRRTVTTFAGPLPLPELVVLQRLRVAALIETARACLALSGRALGPKVGHG